MTIKIGKSLDGLLSAQEFNSVFPQGSDFFKGFFKVVTFVDSLILYAKPYKGCAGEHSIHINWGDGEGVYYLERGSLKPVYGNLFSVILGDTDLSGLTAVVINLKLELDSNLLVSKVGNDIILDKVPSTQKKVKAEKTDLVNVKSPINPIEKEAKSQNMGEVKPRISNSYENLVVRLRFAKALKAEVEGNLGDKITNLYDSKSLKESIKLLAASYTEDKKFILRMHRTQLPTAKGAEYTDYYGVFMKDSKKAKTLAYVSEDGAHFNEKVTREPMPEVLKDGLMGMFGIVKYTARSARVTLNVKITDSSILVDIM